MTKTMRELSRPLTTAKPTHLCTEYYRGKGQIVDHIVFGTTPNMAPPSSRNAPDTNDFISQSPICTGGSIADYSSSTMTAVP